MDKDPELSEKLGVIVSKSLESLNAARSLCAQEYFDDAASKAYYAVFHSPQAILLTLNLSFSKHSGVISGFNKNFVQPGVFPPDFKERIGRLFQERQIGDYSYKQRIGKESARRDIQDAKTIVETIVDYLRRESFLGRAAGPPEQ
ncbi:MAG: HEPN domain-containing protein [Chloroflexi bacterium]|nr:HEPN domain-containing protein [Chloroflexota bacterium]